MKLKSLAWICAALLSALACGQATSSTGSNSNWLAPCTSDAGCNSGLACLCGVCTERCSAANSCGNPDAVCAAVNGTQCGTAEPTADRLCLKGCTDNSECSSGRTCVDGACQRKAAIEPPPPSGPMQLAISASHICVARDGKVWCWGGNGSGESGQTPGNSAYDTPHEVAGVSGVVELAAGNGHTCARTEDGRVFCWGSNAAGQVGPLSAAPLTCYSVVLDRGTKVDEPCQPTPTEVPGLEGAVQLALAGNKSCARLNDGSVSCWGDTANEAEFLAALNDVRDLTVSGNGICAVHTNGAVSCSNAAREPSWKTEFDRGALSSWGNVLCTLKSGGRVDCWGDNDKGQLGIGFAFPSVTYPLFPAAVAKGATQLALGSNHACALLDDGTVQCWGDNDFGTVGINPEATALCPGGACQSPARLVDGLPKAIAIASGANTVCAVGEDASLWCWGATIGAMLNTGSPVRVAGPWQDDGAACVETYQQVTSAIVRARQGSDIGCRTDADCTEVPLEASCFHGCSSGPVSKVTALRIEAQLANVETGICAQPASAGCSAASPVCATPVGKLACFGGTCVRFDAEATGLNSVCEYAAVRQVNHADTVCVQPDLYVASTWPCTGCGSASLYVVLGNSGLTDFDGDALIESLPEANAGDTPVSVPPPLTQHFTIPAQGISAPIAFEYRDRRGLVRLKVTAPDTCNSAVDGTFAETPDAVGCSQ